MESLVTDLERRTISTLLDHISECLQYNGDNGEYVDNGEINIKLTEEEEAALTRFRGKIFEI